MFEHLKKYDKILVTGPQRSGTRICARMCAADTGHHYVDENDIYVDSLNALCKWLKQDDKIVVQCPALMRYVHHLADLDVLVVVVRRKLEDILASQERIEWQSAWPELIRYGEPEGEPASWKYLYWEWKQSHWIDNYIEVEYESLRDHPLWINKEHRADFSPLQTTIEEGK
jgi:hypothetical protein